MCEGKVREFQCLAAVKGDLGRRRRRWGRKGERREEGEREDPVCADMTIVAMVTPANLAWLKVTVYHSLRVQVAQASCNIAQEGGDVAQGDAAILFQELS